jgi:hypothetical protein
MRVEFTHEMIFSFGGPNICLLGNEIDFRNLAESILVLTDSSKPYLFELTNLDFIKNQGEEKQIIFSSKRNAQQFGTFNNNGDLIFALDSKYWERLFKYFVMMSWYKRTYYLNADEDCLSDLELEQDCNFICSSEF